MMNSSPEAVRQARYRFRPGRQCQHNVVLRYYAGDEHLFCDECSRPNRFLYVCVADTPEFSPFDPRPDLASPDVSILSPSVQRAAADGHYNEDQIQRLISQRMKALTTARDQHKESSEPLSDRELLHSSKVDSPQPSEEILQGVLAQQPSTTRLSISDKTNTSGIPCQRQTCAACHPNWCDRAWQSLNTVIHEEYQDPPRIPEFLNRRPVDVRVARNLPEMDVYDWKNSTNFRLWWNGFQRSLGYDASIALDLAEAMNLAPYQFQKLMEWFASRCQNSQRAKDTFSWLWEIQKSPSHLAHFLQTLVGSRTSPWQQEWPRNIRQPLNPDDSVISRPIWEEVENQGELIEIPDWKYSDDLSYSAMYRPVQRRNTGLFSAHRAALARRDGQEAPILTQGITISDPQGADQRAPNDSSS